MHEKTRFLNGEETYHYLWTKHMMGRKIVVPRYGDGEFLIMRGRKKTIATHTPNEKLTELLNRSIKIKNQLICMPAPSKSGSLRSIAVDYFLANSDHNIYARGNWRLYDVQYNFNFLTEFFIGKTLVVTGNHIECKRAFDSNNISIDVLSGRKANAFLDYEQLKKNLIKKARNYKNIIFALGPTSNILIADLAGTCPSHLIDLGGFLGFLINAYSDNESLAKRWTGIPMRSSKEEMRRISKTFFKKLKDKIELYNS
jgi:hypothetical protein